MKLVLATANPNKAREIREIVQDRVSLIPRPQDVPSPVENGGTLLVNARLKAAAVSCATALPALADDTGSRSRRCMDVRVSTRRISQVRGRRARRTVRRQSRAYEAFPDPSSVGPGSEPSLSCAGRAAKNAGTKARAKASLRRRQRVTRASATTASSSLWKATDGRSRSYSATKSIGCPIEDGRSSAS